MPIFNVRSREDLHLLLDGSSGTSFLFDKLIENGEAASVQSSLGDLDKTNLNVLLPPEVSDSFSFKSVTDQDIHSISASIVKLQLSLGNHLRMNSKIIQTQFKVRNMDVRAVERVAQLPDKQ